MSLIRLSLTEKQTKDGADYISIKSNLKALKDDRSSWYWKFLLKKKNTKTVQNGYLENSDVKDCTRPDYAGQWQSVYPYLQDGTF